MDLKPGNLVFSKAGRDKGKIFVVYSVHEPNYIKIVDGKLRKVEKPKLKKTKHVQYIGRDLEIIENKIKRNERISNSEIRKALAEVVENRSTLKEG